MLATEIPNAEFVELDSRNHILLAEESRLGALQGRGARLCRCHDGTLRRTRLFASLSGREREILAALIAGRSNSEIGAALFISDKTVRNSLTRIFEKLGVRTRMQAAVLARDRGFVPAPET